MLHDTTLGVVTEGSDSNYVIEEDRDIEHSVSKTGTKAALDSDMVTDYTNMYLIGYIELTTVEDHVVTEEPIKCTDLVAAAANVLICPIDGGAPGPGVESGTLM